MNLPEGETVYTWVVGHFRKAKTKAELREYGERFTPLVKPLEANKEKWDLATYNSIREAYKYYMKQLN